MALCWTPCAWWLAEPMAATHGQTGRDPLTERICTALGVAEASQIVTTIYSPEFNRARIASLAPEVLAACAEAPEVSEQLLVPAGAALAEIVTAVARSLGWSSGRLPLAVAGGFLLSATVVLQAMIDRLNRQGYQVDVTPVTEPVRGAVILAERGVTTMPTTEGSLPPPGPLLASLVAGDEDLHTP